MVNAFCGQPGGTNSGGPDSAPILAQFSKISIQFHTSGPARSECRCGGICGLKATRATRGVPQQTCGAPVHRILGQLSLQCGSFSILAAITKSLSVRPSILCVQSVAFTFPQAR